MPASYTGVGGWVGVKSSPLIFRLPGRPKGRQDKYIGRQIDQIR